ncbi:Hypothetical predicted protein [Olea europaea subsp. europaea]|uniref:Uncharacterized protein n=1 Tax=Olea europaea subsp. europaea TaxID=158383 RepID=A0A8S0SUS1_OLEEU|nr:Hypothetical predicted protein [Olea europaea subsp. europaea]
MSTPPPMLPPSSHYNISTSNPQPIPIPNLAIPLPVGTTPSGVLTDHLEISNLWVEGLFCGQKGVCCGFEMEISWYDRGGEDGMAPKVGSTLGRCDRVIW